jgi:hypothetical protein
MIIYKKVQRKERERLGNKKNANKKKKSRQKDSVKEEKKKAPPPKKKLPHSGQSDKPAYLHLMY